MTLVVAVVGPTATGKSDLGLALAHALGGEVVNADAMQLYRGMDIGTAKLHRRRAAAASRTTSWTSWTCTRTRRSPTTRRAPAPALDEIEGARPPVRRRRRLGPVRPGAARPHGVPRDRRRGPGAARGRVEAEGARALHAELAAADPVAADGIGPRNARRIVRALEVIEITGRPYSATPPAARLRGAGGADRPGLRPCGAGRADRRSASSGCGRAGSSTRSSACARTGWAGPRRGPSGYAEVLAMLRGELTPGRGARRGRRRHPSARAQADGLVRPGPAGALARRAGPGPRRAGARARRRRRRR